MSATNVSAGLGHIDAQARRPLLPHADVRRAVEQSNRSERSVMTAQGRFPGDVRISAALARRCR